MTIAELVQKDNSFNSSIFISKANNMIKKLYNSTTLDELDNVDHFASDEVFNKFKRKLDDAKSKNLKLVYEQVNVDTNIRDIREENNNYIIYCLVTCKFYKYCLDANGNVVSGDNSSRSTIIHKVEFIKRVGAKNEEVSRCLGCGTPLDINNSGKCPNCGRVFDLEEYDYYINKFE